MSDLRDLVKSLIFGEGTEGFAHIAHQKEGMSESLIFKIKNVYKTYYIQKKILYFFSQTFLRESLIRSFIMSDLSE